VNTRDEAQALNRYLKQHPARRIVVVTTDYHAKRAYWILQQELQAGPEIRLALVPDDTGIGPANWWKTATGWRTYGGEYAKLVLASVRADQLFQAIAPGSPGARTRGECLTPFLSSYLWRVP
jgi:uncharacterized SAM-binding protein YcdF (DUF218 family)